MKALTQPQASGVGGWLAFLVFVLLVMSPLMGYSNLINQEKDALSQYPQLAGNPRFIEHMWALWLSLKVNVVASMSTGFALWKLRTKTVVSSVIAVWWISSMIALSLQAYAIQQLNNSDAWPEWVGGAVASMLVLIGWTIYLIRSKRVQNTYVL